MPGAGIIRNAGIIRGSVLFEEIRYALSYAICSAERQLALGQGVADLQTQNLLNFIKKMNELQGNCCFL